MEIAYRATHGKKEATIRYIIAFMFITPIIIFSFMDKTPGIIMSEIIITTLLVLYICISLIIETIRKKRSIFLSTVVFAIFFATLVLSVLGFTNPDFTETAEISRFILIAAVMVAFVIFNRSDKKTVPPNN